MAPTFVHPTHGADQVDAYAAIKVAAGAVERGDLEGALRLLKLLYEHGIDSAPAEGWSLYGYCLALVENKNKVGIDYCMRAIEVQPYDSSHRAHLIRIYLQNKSRRKAVEVLEEGLRALPKDSALVEIRNAIRYRRPPVIRFLHRDNPLNQLLGRLRYRRVIVVVAQVVFTIVFTATLFIVTFLIALGKL
ncbi:MAG TPA: hypothetical protein VNL91_00330 [Thermoanaerobaculia bacterium]|nr:hypothetical protein [Thermoanaerobaculia bacterium]